MTNYDRIVNMPFDKMVEFMNALSVRTVIGYADHVICQKCLKENDGKCPSAEKCKYELSNIETIKMWLNMEVETGEKDNVK